MSHRLRLGSALLILEGEVVTVVAPQWEPGVFFKHVEHLEARVETDRTGDVLRLSTVGGPVPWQVLRLPIPADCRAAVRAFEEAARAARAASAAR